MNQNYLDTPVHKQSWRELLTALPKRIIGLASKLIGVKITMFAVATVMLVLAMRHRQPDGHTWVPWVVWLFVYIATLFGWDGLKWIRSIAEIRYGRNASLDRSSAAPASNTNTERNALTDEPQQPRGK